MTDGPAGTGSTEGNKGGNGHLLQVPLPQQATVVFVAGLSLGAALICLPTVFRSHFALNGTQSNLVLCIGAGLVLAAFGGQATVNIGLNIGRIVMAGAAAVALGLFAYLQYVSERMFLVGTIGQFDYAKYESLRLANGSKPILGGLVPNPDNLSRSRYEFVVFQNDVDQSILELSFVKRDNKREMVLFVDVKDMNWAFGDRHPIEWAFRDRTVDKETVPAIFDVAKNQYISKDRFAYNTPRMTIAGIAATALSITAFAQSAPKIADIPRLLATLTTDDTAIRRSVRDELSRAPAEAVPNIMEYFRERYDDYRVRLGICVALTQMLRADKGKAGAILQVLSTADLEKLLDAAGDPDRTVRVYASEFLFDLGDPRAVAPAILRAEKTADDNARYNWLLSIQDAWRKLSEADRSKLRPSLEHLRSGSGPRTNDLINKLS